jgi:hypothetical protein
MNMENIFQKFLSGIGHLQNTQWTLETQQWEKIASFKKRKRS